MNIDISIIVPVYNSENYISKCIESVLDQTFSNFELILIDDASTDSTLDIIKKYEKENTEKISVIECQKNGKQGTARNIGIKKANGKYIMFLDSDDILDCYACELMMDVANKEMADIVFCDYCMFDKNKEEYCSHVSASFMGKLNENKRKALITTSVVPWAKLIRHSLITDNDLYFPEGTFYEDQATTYLYYLYANNVAKVEKMLYRYRITDVSTSMQKNQKRHFQAFDMAKLLIQNFKERGFYYKYYQELEYFAIEQMYCLTMERIYKQFDEFPIEHANEVLKELKKEFPNYRNNKYYKYYMPEIRKRLLEVHLENENYLLDYLKNEKNFQCINYTCNLKLNIEKMQKLKKMFDSKQCELALWGAGKYGKIILSEFDKYGIGIGSVYDGNIEKINEEYERFIISDYRNIDSKTLIIIPFVNWVSSIKVLLREMGLTCKIFNFEVYMKHDIEDCIEGL